MVAKIQTSKKGDILILKMGIRRITPAETIL
jgi:hypothetical protein